MGPALYDRLAAIYDRWLDGDEAAEPCLQFYRKALSDETGHVLELGSGTGRICRALAAAGTKIVGLDESALMLQQTAVAPNAIPGSGLKLVAGRFEALPFASGAFAAVLLPMRTLGHLIDPAAVGATFENVYRVLKPGGRFILDHYNLNRAWAEAHNGTFRLMFAGAVADREDRALVIWDRYVYDFAASSLHCVVRIHEVGPSADVTHAREVEFPFRWFSVDEVTAYAKDVGLRLETCSGDFDGTPYRDDSDHMVFTFRKPRKV